MDRESIEARDQRLLKSFRDIVARKQQTRPEPPSFFRMRWILASACAAVLIAIPAWVMISSKPGAPPVQTVDASPEAVSPDSPPVLSIDVGGIKDDAVKEVTTDQEKEPVESQATVQVDETSAPAVEPAVTPTVPPVQVTVSDIQVCRGIENREAVSPTRVFSLGDPVKPTVWMTVMTDGPPMTLRHVYFLNDDHYCTVPLDIRYARTRTWSRVTVSEDSHLGVWRVDVVDESGKVLSQTSFEVLP